jgi:transcriptional regulator with XRE-family HTH domain
MSVYFIETIGADAVKIGQAIDPRSRLVELQSSNHLPLRLIKTVDGSYDVERALHERFAASRIRGEWYRLSEISDQVADLAGSEVGIIHNYGDSVSGFLKCEQCSMPKTGRERQHAMCRPCSDKARTARGVAMLECFCKICKTSTGTHPKSRPVALCEGCRGSRYAAGRRGGGRGRLVIGESAASRALRDAGDVQSIAARIGSSVAAVSNWINGRSTPSLANRSVVAAAFGIEELDWEIDA